MILAVTGHRPQRLKAKEDMVYAWLKEQIDKNNCTKAISGMAVGADMLFANAAIEKKVPLICCYPYKREILTRDKYIVSQAEEVKFISENYYGKQVFFLRDKYMVDNCDILLAVWDGIKNGGTWLTIEYALKIGKPIIYCPL